ncbi:hypothetical protein FACS1894130_02900 [Spirochaetia bacterium]|nr:hypothetical protein FACS1894130_02900 [Spirochaetia bacterium]
MPKSYKSVATYPVHFKLYTIDMKKKVVYNIIMKRTIIIYMFSIACSVFGSPMRDFSGFAIKNSTDFEIIVVPQYNKNITDPNNVEFYENGQFITIGAIHYGSWPAKTFVLDTGFREVFYSFGYRDDKLDRMSASAKFNSLFERVIVYDTSDNVIAVFESLNDDDFERVGTRDVITITQEKADEGRKKYTDMAKFIKGETNLVVYEQLIIYNNTSVDVVITVEFEINQNNLEDTNELRIRDDRSQLILEGDRARWESHRERHLVSLERNDAIHPYTIFSNTVKSLFITDFDGNVLFSIDDINRDSFVTQYNKSKYSNIIYCINITDELLNKEKYSNIPKIEINPGIFRRYNEQKQGG